MSVIALVLATLLIVSAISSGDALATNGDESKNHEEKHDEKKEKHEDKHEDKKEKLKKIKEEIIPKIKEKIKKIKDKIDDDKKDKLKKIKEKIIDKIKEKITDYKEKKSKKISSEEDSGEQDTPIEEVDSTENSNHEDEDINESSNNDEEIFDDTSNEDESIPIIIQEQTSQKTMNKFKGSGDDYAPTLGTDKYGNSYVDNGFTFNGFVTDVEDYTTHMPLQTLQVGEKNTAVLKIYENRGAGKIEHVEIAFGLDYDEHVSQSKNKIIWKQNFKGEQSIIENDPSNLLMDVNAVGKPDGKIMEITFDFAFREPMDKSKIGLVVWDQDKHSRTVYFNDGIEVVGQSLNPPKIVTILDEKGYPVKITMTGKNEGIDEFGNIWTHNSPWIKQGKTEKSLNDTLELAGNHGFDRAHGMFDSYKKSQAQTAQEKLMEILGGHNIYNFND